MRIGIGYDVHRLVKGRKLILGGVEIPFEKGLLGHSDADVLSHAVCDAMLGAAGLGDLGGHFPDSDTRFSGISGLVLLQKILNRLSKKDKNLYEHVLKKIEEIIGCSGIEHYKNLRYDMKDKKRVQIGHFVLVFKLVKKDNKIVFMDFDHHDNIYK